MSDIDLQDQAIQVDTEKGNFKYPENYEFDAGVGLTEDTVKYISDVKDDPDWVREFRLKALEVFKKKPMPTKWAPSPSLAWYTATMPAANTAGCRMA